jgi:hypothetical protein
MDLRRGQGDEKALRSNNHFLSNGCPFLCHPEAKPRDLQFRGPFVEMFFDRAYPDFLRRCTGRDHLSGFHKENRMRFAKATELHRKFRVAKRRGLLVSLRHYPVPRGSATLRFVIPLVPARRGSSRRVGR